MKRFLFTVFSWFLIAAAGCWFTCGLASAEPPIVRAVLFYSPTCPHCHKVMVEDLPPLLEKHGEQLIIVALNTAMPVGAAVYDAAADQYNIPPENRGVPMLLVGDTVLIGSLDIPMQFPGIIENGLVAGGIEWPDIPELHAVLDAENLSNPEDSIPDEEVAAQAASGESVAENPVDGSTVAENSSNSSQDDGVKQTDNATDIRGAALASQNTTIAQRFEQDKLGNSLSITVLLGMMFLVAGVGWAIVQSDVRPNLWPDWIVPVLVLIGTIVALYMGYVEITQSEAVCGPVGDCNTVQQSPYAHLFGLIPIGALGVIGYALIGAIWLMMSYGPAALREFSRLALWFLALFGTLFSIYLTFLEPFVIGATCAWCLTSAIVMALLLLVTTPPVTHTWFANGINGRLFGGGGG